MAEYRAVNVTKALRKAAVMLTVSLAVGAILSVTGRPAKSVAVSVTVGVSVAFGLNPLLAVVAMG